MPADPYTIRIFVSDGDPDGIRLIDRMNWTGVGVVFPREKWAAACQRAELARTGIYILVGYKEGADKLPTLYIGEGDIVRDRIADHFDHKVFWEHCYVFVTTNSGLNKAHVRWLEQALIVQAQKAGRSYLDNVATPAEPPLSEAERADSHAFLHEILQALPIVGLRAFEKPKAIVTTRTMMGPLDNVETTTPLTDVVIVVPAQQDGFRKAFLAENCWYAIRISGGMLPKIKYIAGYQTKPIQAVTHYAPVAAIESYGEDGKYRLNFSEPAKTIGPIPLANAGPALMKSPKYTTLEKLMSAHKMANLFK